MRTRASPCGRFVVVDELHLDRAVFDVVVRWAEGRDLSIQDALQLALCAFRDGVIEPTVTPRAVTDAKSRATY